MKSVYNSKKAFTLAEVLITLAIVGVIASLTIPTLISNLGNKQETVQLKKAYGTFSQAFQLVQNENGGIESVFGSTMDNGSQSMNIFATKLNMLKNCGSGAGCLYTTALKYYNGSQANANLEAVYAGAYSKIILADGSMVIMYSNQSNCTTTSAGYTGPLLNSVCGWMIVDVNGAKGPNTLGKDYFAFYITKTGIQPYGSNGDGNSCGAGNDWATSHGCTATVLAGR